MPGTGAVGKLFFKKFLGDFGSQKLLCGKANRRDEHGGKAAFTVSGLPARCLVVGKIIRRERLRRRIDFVAARRSGCDLRANGKSAFHRK